MICNRLAQAAAVAALAIATVALFPVEAVTAHAADTSVSTPAATPTPTPTPSTTPGVTPDDLHWGG